MRILPLVLALALVAAGCAQDSAAGSPEALVAAGEQDGPRPPTTTVPVDTTTSSVAPTTSETPPPPTTVTSTTTVAAPVSAAPFASSVAPVTATELGASWRAGCPVAVEDLRALTVRHRTADVGSTEGVLVVHRDHAEAIVAVFAAIYEAGFPITSMRPVSEFGADDDRSMAADNTSAFNCRPVAGRPGVWSQHSYGTAIDINPLLNPWVRGGAVDPPAGAPYADRGAGVPGMITAGDAVTTAFAGIGWIWGGTWSTAKDYQHFSANGR